MIIVWRWGVVPFYRLLWRGLADVLHLEVLPFLTLELVTEQYPLSASSKEMSGNANYRDLHTIVPKRSQPRQSPPEPRAHYPVSLVSILSHSSCAPKP